MTDKEREAAGEFLLSLLDAAFEGAKWGLIIGMAWIALGIAHDLAKYTQATYSLVREMRADARASVASADKEIGTE